MKNTTMAPLILVALVIFPLSSLAGARIAIDDTKWASLGVGIRTSYRTTEDGAASGTAWSHDFNVDNARIYINGQVHEYIKFEFNTDCVFCGTDDGSFELLDAIVKIELNQYFNVWAGRLIVPGERQEMNGPFYSSTYDPYQTPFVSSDFSTTHGSVL